MKLLKRAYLKTSLLVLVLSSCSSYKPSNITTEGLVDQRIKNRHFDLVDSSYLYRVRIQIYNENLNGIFVVKKINEDAHRVVLTSDFGNTLYDCTVSAKKFKVHSAVPQLNKWMVKRILQRDFRLLVHSDVQAYQKLTTDAHDIYVNKSKRRKNYYSYKAGTNELEQIASANNRKVKLAIDYYKASNPIQDSIVLQHYAIPLKMVLAPLQQD